VVRQRELERAGCWSHLRPYFYDALQHHPEEARLALGTIRDLFAIERQLWRQAPEVVPAGHAARSKPLVEGFCRGRLREMPWLEGYLQAEPLPVAARLDGLRQRVVEYLRDLQAVDARPKPGVTIAGLAPLR